MIALFFVSFQQFQRMGNSIIVSCLTKMLKNPAALIFLHTPMKNRCAVAFF